MPKILLIQPLFANKDLDRNVKTIYPIGLGYLAAYVPEHWEVSVIDEQFDQVDYAVRADVVGLSVTTATVNRAYAIAAEFRKRGVTVIMGGVHVSLRPDEAAPYCDSVVIGDGEHVIGNLLADFEKGKLKKRYEGALEPLRDLRPPRRDLFPHGYTFLPVSTSRGCPFDCHFCAINRFYKGKYRTREVEDVMAELRSLPKGYEIVFFTDGNIYGYAKNDTARFKELCRRIIQERPAGKFNFKYFTGYASVNILDDPEALDLAAAAGCSALFIGFESINPASLKDMNKVLNLKYGPDSYYDLVENARRRKILVVGEMIVGNDSDDAEVLARTSAFLRKINFDILRLQILQPVPGTRLYEQLERENRLLISDFPADWDKMTNSFVMGVHYVPKSISAGELKAWVKKTGSEFYSHGRIMARAWKNFMITKSLRIAVVTIAMNYKSRKSYVNAKL